MLCMPHPSAPLPMACRISGSMRELRTLPKGLNVLSSSTSVQWKGTPVTKRLSLAGPVSMSLSADLTCSQEGHVQVCGISFMNPLLFMHSPQDSDPVQVSSHSMP